MKINSNSQNILNKNIYTSLFDNVENPVFIFDSNNSNSIIYVNHSFERLCGFNNSELIGYSITKFISLSNNTQKDLIDLSTTDTHQDEMEIKLKNGKSKKLLLSTNPLKDDSNKVIAVAGFVSMNDASKTNVSQQSDTNYITRDIINHLPNFLIVTDSQLKINYWNTALEKRTGFSKKDIKQKFLSEIFPDLKIKDIEKYINEVLENNKTFKQKISLNFDNNITQYYRLHIVSINSNGNKQLLWNFVDITQEELLNIKTTWQNSRLKFLENFSQILNTNLDLKTIITSFSVELREIFSFNTLYFLLPYNLEKLQFNVLYQYKNDTFNFPNNELLDLSCYKHYDTLIEKKTLQIQNIGSNEDERALTSAEIKYTKDLKQIVQLPIMFENELLGILNLGNNEIRSYKKNDLDFLLQIATHLAITLKNSFYFNLIGLQNKKLFIINSIFNAPQNTHSINQICENTLYGLSDLLKCQSGAFFRSTDGKSWQKIISLHKEDPFPSILNLPESILKEKTKVWDKINPSIVDLEASGFEDLSQAGLFSWESSSSFGYLAFISLNNLILDQINRSFIASLVNDIIKQMIITIDQISLFEKLKRAENEWATTFNTVEIGLVVVNEQFQILRTNNSFLKLYNYKLSDILGRECKDTFCNIANREKCCKEELGKKDSPQYEDEYIDNRIQKRIHRIFYPIYSSKKQFKGGVFSIQDVTERRKQEANIRFLSKFPETNPNLVISVDYNGEIQYINPSVRKFIDEFMLTDKEVIQLLPKDLNSILNKFIGHSSNYIELEHKFRDIIIQYFIYKPEDDDQLYFYGTDITEKISLQNQLLQTERIKAVGEMAAGVAHDFNNLLATILGRTQLLLLKSEKEEFQNELKVIEKAAVDGGKIVKRMQEVTRRRREKNFDPLDIVEIIKESIIFTASKLKISTQLKGKKFQLRTEFKDRSIVKGDSVELKEVFTNLILNAYDAMPNGGELYISTTNIEDESVRIVIKDTGVGIPEGVRNKIFNPFFTTKGEKGTGLGLSIVYKTITAHKGYINVRSRINKGSLFTIILPLTKEDLPKKKIDKHYIDHKYGEAKLLIVDDEPELLDTMAEILRIKFKTVEIAPGGKEALEKNKKQKFDIILSDLGMPEMSGWDLAESIKKNNPNSKIILVTGWGEQAREELKHHPYVDDILAKPYSIDDLLEKIRLFFTKNS